MIYHTEPENFHSRFDIVSCISEYNGKVLVLLRQTHKPQGNMWGLPSGKVDSGESLEQAVKRELNEETGIDIPERNFKYHKKVFVKYPDYDFIYHLFVVTLENPIDVIINPKEHTQYKWMDPSDAMSLKDGIEDLDTCLRLYYS